MANAAGLDSHYDIARAGIGQNYLGEFNGSMGLARSDTTNGLRHEATLLMESRVAEQYWSVDALRRCREA